MTPGRTGVDGRSAKDVLPFCVYLSCLAKLHLNCVPSERVDRACEYKTPFLLLRFSVNFISCQLVRVRPGPTPQEESAFLAIRIQDPDPASVFRAVLEGSVLTCRAEKLATCLDALVNHRLRSPLGTTGTGTPQQAGCFFISFPANQQQ